MDVAMGWFHPAAQAVEGSNMLCALPRVLLVLLARSAPLVLVVPL